jgi:hypothetical protein
MPSQSTTEEHSTQDVISYLTESDNSWNQIARVFSDLAVKSFDEKSDNTLLRIPHKDSPTNCQILVSQYWQM